MAVCQNPIPLVNIKIAGKWMFIPLKMVCIGIDPNPYIIYIYISINREIHYPLGGLRFLLPSSTEMPFGFASCPPRSRAAGKSALRSGKAPLPGNIVDVFYSENMGIHDHIPLITIHNLIILSYH